jgi:hypothetical protein
MNWRARAWLSFTTYRYLVPGNGGNLDEVIVLSLLCFRQWLKPR